MYSLATMHNVTDRRRDSQTDNIMMPIAGHKSWRRPM